MLQWEEAGVPSAARVLPTSMTVFNYQLITRMPYKLGGKNSYNNSRLVRGS
jgi:hypothetical protein